MNKNFLILSLIIFSNAIYAQSAGTAFSYQGQLLDNGSPANDKYDIVIDAYTDEFGNSLIDTYRIFGLIVEDGILTIPNVDFGLMTLGNEVWLEVSIKKTNDTGGFETLTGRQKVNAVPFALESEFANNASLAQHSVTSGEAATVSNFGANANDVYTFNGALNQWQPSAKEWVKNNGVIAAGNNNDNVSIGANNTTALLEINASNRQAVTGLELFKAVSTFNEIVFQIDSFGDTYIGGFKLGLPNNSLYVKGDTWQDLSSGGMMKFMARVDCNVNNGPTTPMNLKRSFNGVDNLQIEYISPASGFGNCIIDFKHDISSRFWQASAVGSNGDRLVNCDLVSGNNNQLLCQQRLMPSGSQASGDIMILVY